MTALSVDIPVIETERLILREPREADLPAVAAFLASERSGFVGGNDADPWKAWALFASGLGHWFLRGYGFWTLQDRQTGRPAGRVGFTFPPIWSEPELGWQVYDGFEGQGLAYEAAMAARAAGPRLFGLDGVISHVDPANTRSRRLAERMGAAVERESELLGKPVLIYRHPRAASTNGAAA